MLNCDITSYGAIGDGKTLNTTAIQAAIDDCARCGGGRVTVPDGAFITGSIELRSNVEVHIEAGGILYGSGDCKDYPERQNLRHVDAAFLPRRRSASLIFAEECENIALTGPGRIDGQGDRFVRPVENSWMPYKQLDLLTPPRVVFFAGCSNVRVENLTLQNSPGGWAFWVHDCDEESFDRENIRAKVEYPNNDGIHINCSRNVTVSNCNITCGDDCIIVRANTSSLREKKACDGVTVTNCNLTTWCNAIRVGWLNDGVIRNCVFSNLVIRRSGTGIGISLPSRSAEPPESDDTLIENLTFSNIVMDEMAHYPIFIEIHAAETTRCRAVRNLLFSGIQARAHRAPFISGRANCPIENVTFADCRFEKYPAAREGERIRWGAARYEPVPYQTVVIRNVENLVMNNTTFSLPE